MASATNADPVGGSKGVPIKTGRLRVRLVEGHNKLARKGTLFGSRRGSTKDDALFGSLTGLGGEDLVVLLTTTVLFYYNPRSVQLGGDGGRRALSESETPLQFVSAVEMADVGVFHRVAGVFFAIQIVIPRGVLYIGLPTQRAADEWLSVFRQRARPPGAAQPHHGRGTNSAPLGRLSRTRMDGRVGGCA